MYAHIVGVKLHDACAPAFVLGGRRVTEYRDCYCRTSPCGNAGFWEHLQRCSNLTTLHITHTELSYEMERARLPFLRDLSLASCLGLDSCPSFFTFHSCLWKLDLSGSAVSDDELNTVVRRPSSVRCFR